MTDHISKQQRSWNMSRIRSKNTKPELVIRSMLHVMGFRFRLHRKNLPGNPDIVLPKYKTVIFVHGCFWHRHKNCKRCTIPKTNFEYWNSKFQKNVIKDQKNRAELIKLGWNVITIWECQTNNADTIQKISNQIFKKNVMKFTIYSI